MPFSDVLSTWRQRKVWMPCPSLGRVRPPGLNAGLRQICQPGLPPRGGYRGVRYRQSSGHLGWSTALQSTSREDSFSGWGEWRRTINDLYSHTHSVGQSK